MTTPATPRQRIVQRLLAAGKRELDSANAPAGGVLEQMIHGILRENAPRADADLAYRELQTRFFDWNEVRVSSHREIAEALAGLPDADLKAARIIDLLGEVFETTFSFDLESLIKKGLRQAEKQIERYRAANPYMVAYTLQRGLDGHALPIDQAMRRTLARLELLGEAGSGPDAAEPALDHLVPKSRGLAFCEAVSALAHEFCTEANPNCRQCPMNDLCPAGQANLRSVRSNGRASRAKAR